QLNTLLLTNTAKDRHVRSLDKHALMKWLLSMTVGTKRPKIRSGVVRLHTVDMMNVQKPRVGIQLHLACIASIAAALPNTKRDFTPVGCVVARARTRSNPLGEVPETGTDLVEELGDLKAMPDPLLRTDALVQVVPV